MSSQNNNSRKSLNELSNYILSEQSIDIKNYTVGHLNENHLLKLDPIKTAFKWDSNKIKPRKHPQKRIKVKPYSSMSDINEIMTNFREQDTLISERLLEGPFKKNPDEKQLFDGLVRLPDLHSNHKKSSESDQSKAFDNFDDNSNTCFPITDKELAINFLNGPFKGASKAEKLNSLTHFEKTVIQKKCLIATNNLHTIDSVNWLEEKLKSGLQKLENLDSDHKFQINIYRLDIFNNIFEQIIVESKLFGTVLHRIKEEYDEYLFYLLRNQQLLKLNSKNFQKKLDTARYFYSNNIDLIKRATMDIEATEKNLGRLVQDKANLEKSINSENEFSLGMQKSLDGSQLTIKTNRTSNKDRASSKGDGSETQSATTDRTQQKQKKIKPETKKVPISENIEATKFEILQKINSLEKVNEDLKKDYVPMQIINNLNQSIKQTEVSLFRAGFDSNKCSSKSGPVRFRSGLYRTYASFCVNMAR